MLKIKETEVENFLDIFDTHLNEIEDKEERVELKLFHNGVAALKIGDKFSISADLGLEDTKDPDDPAFDLYCQLANTFMDEGIGDTVDLLMGLNAEAHMS